MRSLRKLILPAALLAMILMNSHCSKMRTGVCTGYSAEFNSTYCKDGWTEEECDDWDEQQVNGVDWHFHQGQTCEERGTPATP